MGKSVHVFIHVYRYIYKTYRYQYIYICKIMCNIYKHEYNSYVNDVWWIKTCILLYGYVQIYMLMYTP
jgi:hypothetical protein